MQTLALLGDSWRLLLSRKLFWFTLAINVVVVALYGSTALTDTGVSLFYGLLPIESERFRAGSALASTVLIPLINVQIISFWLAWAATGLGLISTASMFPDFLADGAIDMVLAKPMTRLKVFIVKYIGALLFMFAQVTVFCVASLVVGRIRLGEWQWMLLAAIPVVTLFFSYLYAVSALVGVMTRSAIAAILAAAVFWFAIFLVQFGESTLLRVSTLFGNIAEAREEQLQKEEVKLSTLIATGVDEDSNEYLRAEGLVSTQKREFESESKTAASLKAWHTGFYITSMVIPKTAGTIGLIDRWFAKDAGVSSLWELIVNEGERSRRGPRGPELEGLDSDRDFGTESELEANRAIAERPVSWVIGTSLAFELVVVALAAIIFVRRDF